MTGSVVAKFYNTDITTTDVSGDVTLGSNNITSLGNDTIDALQDTGASTGELSVEAKLGIVMSMSMLVGFTQVMAAHCTIDLLS